MSEKKIATIYDYKRMCETLRSDCRNCPLRKLGSFVGCNLNMNLDIDKTNDIILKWCEEHPIKTRQSDILKLFPNTVRYNNAIDFCPRSFEPKARDGHYCSTHSCFSCKKDYWLQEVE